MKVEKKSNVEQPVENFYKQINNRYINLNIKYLNISVFTDNRSQKIPLTEAKGILSG